MSRRDRQSRAGRRNRPEASYDEASRARSRLRASRPGGSGPGGTDVGFSFTRRFFIALLGVVAAKLAWLQVFQSSELASAAESQRTNRAVLHAKRGTIYDRNGNALAVSVDCQTIYANPSVVEDPSGVSEVLVSVLGGEKDSYMDLLTQDTTFVYIRRQVDQEVADKLSEELEARELTGVYFLEDTKRAYPYGSIGSQVIGYVGVDGNGLSGLESYYEDVLLGTDGEMIFETGLDGTPIAGGATQITPAKDGTDLVISLDVDLQEVAESVIAEAAETFEAESGSVMVTNPRTGEILAACSTPLADLDDLTDASALNLKAVSNSYEPGSVFKVLTTSIGIEEGFFTEDTVYTVPAEVKVGDDYVTDVDDRDYTMDMSVKEMLTRSSNTAMALLVQDVMGADAFAEGVARFGIGETTGIDFPGESAGIVRAREQYDGSTAGSMAFGQGLAVPMVQIVRAFGAVANGGVPTTPHFLVYKGEEEVSWPEGERIISEETAAQEIDMMRAVMTEGTGASCQVDGYDFAGKTGTGEQADEDGGYLENSFVSSLCGFANADDPELLLYVGLNHTPYHSSDSSGRAFKEIAEHAVSIMGVQPAS